MSRKTLPTSLRLTKGTRNALIRIKYEKDLPSMEKVLCYLIESAEGDEDE